MISERKLFYLKPEELSLSPHQPRKNFDEYKLRLLANSIAASGILQPLSVRKKSDGGYELIAGERRLRAAVMAGLKKVPCVLHKTDEGTAALYSLIENIQRCDLTVFEEAAGIERLMSEYGLSQAEVAARLGLAGSTLCNKLRILKLEPALQERITAAGLTERHARALLRIPEERRKEALDRMIAEGMTLRQTEEYIAELLNPPPKPEKPGEPVRKAAIGDVRLFSNSLAKLLDTLEHAGIEAESARHEDEKYIEFQVRIRKNNPENEEYGQLKIC